MIIQEQDKKVYLLDVPHIWWCVHLSVFQCVRELGRANAQGRPACTKKSEVKPASVLTALKVPS